LKHPELARSKPALDPTRVLVPVGFENMSPDPVDNLAGVSAVPPKDSADDDFTSEKFDQVLSDINRKYKNKIVKACGKSANCVTVISGAAVKRARSIKEAVSIAGDGDIVWIGEGDYNEVLDINNRKNLVIVGNKSNIISEKDEGIINILESSGVTLYGLHVVHNVGENCSHNCINVHNSRHVRILNNDIDGSGYMGIFSLGCRDMVVSNNIIHHCTHGIIAHSDSSNTISLTNNKFFDNKESNTEESDGNIFQEDFETNNEFGDIVPKVEPESDNPDEQTIEEEPRNEGDNAPLAR
jgi:parallel beta-helix repeat protein